MISHKRGRFHWSEAIHHWTTALFCCFMLQGYYIPTATWYGTLLVQLMFPIGFLQGLRAVYPTIVKKSDRHEQWANLIRNLSKCTIYWYITLVILNLTGQCYVYFGRIFGVFGSEITIVEMVVLPIAIIAWLRDDYSLLKALWGYSNQEYELAAGLGLESPRTHNTSSNVINVDEMPQIFQQPPNLDTKKSDIELSPAGLREIMPV